jgi:hypothetical protein
MQRSAVQCVEDVVQSSGIQCNEVQCNAVRKITALHDGCDGSAREYAFQFSCSLCWPLFYKITKNWNLMQECFISDHKSGPLICSLQGPPRCEQNWMSIIIVRACFISLPPSPPLPATQRVHWTPGTEGIVLLSTCGDGRTDPSPGMQACLTRKY